MRKIAKTIAMLGILTLICHGNENINGGGGTLEYLPILMATFSAIARV